MIVLMTVLLTGQRRSATRQGNSIRHIVIMVVVVVLPKVMRLGPMRVRHSVRHGQAGRREAGDQRQQDDGPAGPGGSGHSGNVYPRRGAPRECDRGQRGNGFSVCNGPCRGRSCNLRIGTFLYSVASLGCFGGLACRFGQPILLNGKAANAKTQTTRV